MEFEAVLRKRRSIRRFLHIPVEREKIIRIITAGNEAPCAGNIINWRFIMVQDETLKRQIAEAALEQYWIAEAPYIIVVCSVNEQVAKYYGKRGEKLYSIQNCAAAIENMLLETTNQGLGSCWVGAFDENEIRRVLGIPENARPQAILPIGYPAELVPRPMRFTLEDITYINTWDSKMEFVAAYLHDYKLIEKATKTLKGWLNRLIKHE